MKKTYLALAAVVVCGALLSCLSACSDIIGFGANRKVVEYSAVVSSGDELVELDRYPNLQFLDLCGSDCYDAIEEYIAAHPQVNVKYDVHIGENRYANDTKELTVVDGEYDYDLLMDRIAYLPELVGIDLPGTTLDEQQLSAIREAYPEITVDYSVMLLGQDMPKDISLLDLSAMDSDQINDIAGQLGCFTNLSEIKVKDENGECSLSPVDIKKLYNAVPGVFIDYSFELFGQTLSTTDETMEYIKADIGNYGVWKIRQALDIMPKCTYVKLDDCGIDNEVMEKLRDDYPDVKVVWRIFVTRTSYLTDVEMIHWTKRVSDEGLSVLKYCTDLMYLDLGHNSLMSDISFINYMPKLKIAILVDSKISDLSPLANCPDLEHIELVNCRELYDLSPLANCTKLKRVNISSTFGITDLSPLFGHKDMERLYVGGNQGLKEQVEMAREMLPNCWVSNVGGEKVGVSGNYAVGWRLDRDLGFADWYLEMREIFQYDIIK